MKKTLTLLQQNQNICQILTSFLINNKHKTLKKNLYKTQNSDQNQYKNLLFETALSTSNMYHQVLLL